ncbi:MAG TPA: hypothetical protein VFM18_04790 [Methanosarcina sp.]|nr:hypothetical protein [Methanosarcina sp.]
MSDTTFVDGVTVIPTTWAQDVNNTVYRALGSGGVAPTDAATVLSNIGAQAAATAINTGNIASQHVALADNATNATNATNASVAPYSGLTGIPANIAAVGGTDSICKIKQATAQASTSGTSINFSSIPSWVKEISIGIVGVSTSGSNQLIVQIGTGGTPTTTGYLSCGAYAGTTNTVVSNTVTTGFSTEGPSGAAVTRHGIITLLNLGSNVWAMSSTQARSDSAYVHVGAGSITLGGVLDYIRITSVGSTDTFDAGTINIVYKGY